MRATIETRCASPKHADLIAAQWLETSKEWPKPADIVDMCFTVADPESEQAKISIVDQISSMSNG